MEERIKGLKRSRFSSISLIIVFPRSNFLIAKKKNTRVRYTTRKQMTMRPLMSPWRMPSQIGDRRNARVGARLTAYRDMFVTRNLGLAAMGRGISKIRARRRTTLTDRRGEVGLGAS